MKTTALLVFLVLTSPALGASLATTDDGRLVLANKDVNGERWAITYDRQRSSVTGNVLQSNGEATFLDCPSYVQDGNLYLSCRTFAGGAWGSQVMVTLPESFFGLDSQACARVPAPIQVVYSDSCGLVATADISLGSDPCRKFGTLSDASDPRLEGAQLEADFAGDGTVTWRLDYLGACQGTASGTGSIVNYRLPGWLAQGSISGSASCCENLQAQLGLQY